MRRLSVTVWVACAFLAASALLSCALESTRDSKPEQIHFRLGAAPTEGAAAPHLTLEYPTIANQPLRGAVRAVSDDGQRILIARDTNGLESSGESVDGGSSWTFGAPRPQEIWSRSMTHALRPATREVSHDGGATWSPLPAGPQASVWCISDAGEVVGGDQTWRRLPHYGGWGARLSGAGVLTVLEVRRDYSATTLLLRRSIDGAQTWSPPVEVTLEGEDWYQDQTLGFFSSDGMRVFFSNRKQIAAT